MKYVYSVVRFVPDPVRGEFVNVGLIVGSDETTEWKLRLLQNKRRAHALDDERRVSRHLFVFLDGIERQLEAHRESIERGAQPDEEVEAVGEAWLCRLASHSGNIVQLTAPAPVVAENADEVLHELFDTFIVDPEATRRPIVTRSTVYAGLNHAYESARPLLVKGGVNVLHRVEVKGGPQREAFDFVVANGRVVQMAQAWSFQVADQEELEKKVKAWAWSVRAIREKGGGVVANGVQIAVPKDVEIDAVYVDPVPGQDPAVKEVALEAFRELDVVPYLRGQEQTIAERAVALSTGVDLH